MTRPAQPEPYPGDNIIKVAQSAVRSAADSEDSNDEVVVTKRPPQPEPYPGDVPPHLRTTQESASIHVYPRVFRSFR